MSDFYRELQGIATDLLSEFNQGDIQYVEIVPGDGPIDDPVPPREIPHAVNGVARGVQQRYVTGSDIVQSDMQVTFDVRPGIVPAMSGYIRGDGKRGKIVGVKQIPPFGVPVAYVIIFRS